MTPPDWLAGGIGLDLPSPPEFTVAASRCGIQRMNGVRSATLVMYQSLLAGSHLAPSAFTASFSAKGVTRLILMDDGLHPAPNRRKDLTSGQTFRNTPMDLAFRLLAIRGLHWALQTGIGMPHPPFICIHSCFSAHTVVVYSIFGKRRIAICIGASRKQKAHRNGRALFVGRTDATQFIEADLNVKLQLILRTFTRKVIRNNGVGMSMS